MQGNVNIPDSTITTNLSFRQLVLMNMQQLTNFPYIEKDFDALTDYELLCLVVKFLNDVIANQNEQNASITRMYESFLALQDYVNNTKDELEDAFNALDDYVRNYFDNLDVQDEINNKLDQMLEDGVLEQIIEQFIQSTAIWSFDNVADMKLATNLIDGSACETIGFYNRNDGGSAQYIIRTKTNDDVIDEVTLISLLDTNLVAELILDNIINVEVLGIKNDSSLNYSNLNLVVNKGITVLFTKGEYTGNINVTGNLNIKFVDSVLNANNGIAVEISNANNCNYELNVKNALNGVQFNTCNNLNIKAKAKTCSQHGVYINDSDNINCEIDVEDTGACGFLCNPLTKDCNNLYIKGITKNTGLTSNTSPSIYFASGDNYIIKNSTVECKCYNSGYSGIYPFGDNNTCINCLVDGTGAVTSVGASGIWVHDSKDIKLINCTLTHSKRHGILVNKAINTLIDNCISYENDMAGIYLAYDNNATGRYQQDNANYKCNISNSIFYNNSKANAGIYSGITFDGYRDTTITNCIAFDDQSTKTQGRGISNVTNEKLDNIVIANCNFRNNLYGDVQIDWTKVKYANYQTSNGLMLGMNGKQSQLVGGLTFGGGNEVTTMRYLDVNNATTSDVASYVVNLVNRLKNMGIL